MAGFDLEVDDDGEREDVEEDVGADVEGCVGEPVACGEARGVGEGRFPEGAEWCAGCDDGAQCPEAIGEDDDGHDGVDGVAGVLVAEDAQVEE